MSNDVQPGDEVEWNSEVSKGAKQKVEKGVVKEELTKPTNVDGHKVNASPDDPTYVVEGANGDEEAHGASALRKQS